MEFHASFLDGVAAPGWLCGGTLSGITARPTWEIAYNHFANRLRFIDMRIDEFIADFLHRLQGRRS